MVTWPAHELDELVDVSAFTGEREFALVRSHRGELIEQARAAYVDGRIDADELERRIDEALA